MTTSELLKKLHKLTENVERADKKQIKQLRKTLRKLKSKQSELKAKLEDTTGEHEARKIKQEIEVLKLQRTKGVRIYKELKRDREQS
jgi:predicted  nucleic acid-binding Zn-ribbon protein